MHVTNVYPCDYVQYVYLTTHVTALNKTIVVSVLAELVIQYSVKPGEQFMGYYLAPAL